MNVFKQQEGGFSKSKFYGTESFKFCDEELNEYKGCEKFCEELTGMDCKPVRSKAQRLEKDVCYFYPPQVEMDDPCQYCEVICEPS